MIGTDELFLRDVEVDGRIVDVAIEAGRIDRLGPELSPTGGSEVVEGHGGALIPGLHDHHLHLLAAAAAATSVATGPADVGDQAGLARALQDADGSLAPGLWLRAVGYHHAVAGDLDRESLDLIVAHRPVRIQHRSGARWTLNSAAIDALDLTSQAHPGIERDGRGRPTGRLHRADGWLRGLLPDGAPPDLAALGGRLAACGVTGVTDTTPSTRIEDLDAIARAAVTGALPQRVMVTGGPELLGTPTPAGVETGPVKLVVDDAAYPDLDDLARDIGHAHEHDRPVAIHCVSLTALVISLAAWDMAASRAGDRLEHGSVIPPGHLDDLARHGITVVTQPGFVAERGDEYLEEVDRHDLPHLYPCRRLLDAGIRVGGSTDAPYTTPDPWSAMRAAVARTTRRGTILGGAEAISPRRALGLFLGELHDPGGPARTVQVGRPADLCLLRHPLDLALERLTADDVMATVRAGRMIHRR